VSTKELPKEYPKPCVTSDTLYNNYKEEEFILTYYHNDIDTINYIILILLLLLY